MTLSGAAMQNAGANQELVHSLPHPACLTPDILTWSATIQTPQWTEEIRFRYLLGKTLPYHLTLQFTNETISVTL